MPRKLSDWLLLPAIVVFLLFWTLALTGSLPAPPQQYQPIADSSTKCATRECRQEANEKALTDYTGELAWFTGVLALVSFMQGIFLWRADRASRRAFEASEKATRDSMDLAVRQFDLQGLQTDIQRQEFLATHRATLEVRFVHEVAGGIEITVINTGTGTARFVAARAGIWHLLDGESFPSPHDLLEGNTFSLRDTFGPSESDRCTIVDRGDEFAEGFGSPAHIFGWIVYDTVAPTPVRRTTYFGRRTEIMQPELSPVEGSDWNFIQ
jgi:hypothetical protein